MDDLPALPPQPDPSGAVPYPKTLALELVLGGQPPADILADHGISVSDFVGRISKLPTFAKEYRELAEQAKQEGFSFRMKAKAQAEGMLATTWAMVQDAKTPASVRADLIKFTTRVAGLDAKEGESAGPKDKVTININLGGEASPRVITGEVVK